jgi:hypothetical protein
MIRSGFARDGYQLAVKSSGARTRRMYHMYLCKYGSYSDFGPKWRVLMSRILHHKLAPPQKW